MQFQVVKGDLFSCDPAFSLCHCISEDCAMGKGIAVEFKKRFGQIGELKKQVANGATTGSCAYLSKDGQFVYYLITKKKYWDKPTIDDLKSSLEAMRKLILEGKVEKLAMPKIGCGLDKLKWSDVEPLIKDTFKDDTIEIRVYEKSP